MTTGAAPLSSPPHSRPAAAFARNDTRQDAALIVTLDPGIYTVMVSGVGGVTGNALVELYDLAPWNGLSPARRIAAVARFAPPTHTNSDLSDY